jgi:Xaa-Pro aminopeptidase
MTGGSSPGRYAERLDRAARTAGEAGLGGLLATPGPDLAYLTGHTPPPLARLTLLVIAPGRDPVLLVPLLERPAALASPAADLMEVVGWADGDDPYIVAVGLLPPGRLAVTDQTWASHVLGLEEAAKDRSFVASGRAMPPLRAVKDPAELGARGGGGGGPPPPPPRQFRKRPWRASRCSAHRLPSRTRRSVR